MFASCRLETREPRSASASAPSCSLISGRQRMGAKFSNVVFSYKVWNIPTSNYCDPGMGPTGRSMALPSGDCLRHYHTTRVQAKCPWAMECNEVQVMCASNERRLGTRLVGP